MRVVYSGPCKYRIDETKKCPLGYPVVEVKTSAGWDIVTSPISKRRVCKKAIPGFKDPLQSAMRKGKPSVPCADSDYHRKLASERFAKQTEAINKMIAEAGRLYSTLTNLDDLEKFHLTREYMREVRRAFDHFTRRGK